MEEVPLSLRNWLKDFHRMAELVQFWEGRFHVKTGPFEFDAIELWTKTEHREQLAGAGAGYLWLGLIN